MTFLERIRLLSFAVILVFAASAPALAQKLAEFPEVLARAAAEFSPHLVTYYLHDDVAARLHTYYNAERFLVEDETLKHARLSLVAATRQVLANGLAVLGVSAPVRM